MTASDSVRTQSSLAPSWNEGRAVHIGLNVVDPTVYDDLLPRLQSAESDAESMRDLANSAGFSSRVLLGEDATYENVRACLAATIERLIPGDVFLLTYSGHMTSIPGIGDDPDGWDEAWCLHDGILLDDEFHALLAEIPAGVDVIVITDSCFASGITDEGFTAASARLSESGFQRGTVGSAPGAPSDRVAGALAASTFGVAPSTLALAGVGGEVSVRAPRTRFGGPEVARLVREARIPRGAPRRVGARPSIAARVISLAAAGEGELAFEGSLHGFFTAALLDVVAESRDEPASYAELMAAISTRIPMQRPTIGVFGAALPADAATAAFVPQSVAPAGTGTKAGLFGIMSDPAT